jgi:RNA polymerase sigma factor (TIGR02999 family)
MADVTELLQRWRGGDRDAENELFVSVLPKLRRLAQYFLKGERRSHSLQATELIDQTYLRLVKAKDRDWRSRAHFFAIAGRVMRRYLVDQARAKPNVMFVALEDLQEHPTARAQKVELALTVDRLLDQLEQTNPDWCRVVEVKYFLGLTDEEAADALGLKLRTMQRMWFDARQWLFEHKEAAGAGQQSTG